MLLKYLGTLLQKKIPGQNMQHKQQENSFKIANQ